MEKKFEAAAGDDADPDDTAPDSGVVPHGEGQLSCGLRNDPGNPDFWFTLIAMQNAKASFCSDLFRWPVKWAPTLENRVYKEVIPALNGFATPQSIAVDITWMWANMSCPTLDTRAAGEQMCNDRLGTVINNCKCAALVHQHGRD